MALTVGQGVVQARQPHRAAGAHVLGRGFPVGPEGAALAVGGKEQLDVTAATGSLVLPSITPGPGMGKCGVQGNLFRAAESPR